MEATFSKDFVFAWEVVFPNLVSHECWFSVLIIFGVASFAIALCTRFASSSLTPGSCCIRCPQVPYVRGHWCGFSSTVKPPRCKEPEFNTQSYSGVFSAGLADNLAGRLAIRYTTTDGYVENRVFDRDEAEREDMFARATLAWQPTESLNAVSYTHLTLPTILRV